MSGNKQYLNDGAKAFQDHLPDHHGFIILAVPFEGGDQRVKYVSNLKREDAIKVLKEWLFRVGEHEEWMKRI